jgi:heptosyltransferase I
MRRILFVKTSSLGDVVHHCPAVSDAARRIAGAEIDWVVEEPFDGIARLHRAARRVIPVALRRWRRAPWRPAVWSQLAEFRRAIAAERYDAVIDTQSLLKSALIAALARGPRHGMDRASAREPLAARFYDTTHAVPKTLHAVERNRRLTAAALGYALDATIDYGLHIDKASSAGDEGEYAVFLTMTSRADKLWPSERWIELGRSLGVRIALPWGSEAEKTRAQAIAERIGNATVPSHMPLTDLARFLSKAKCIVGVDTGLTHVAAALARPTVGIYCGSDPARTGLYGAARAVHVGSPGRPPSVGEVMKALA